MGVLTDRDIERLLSKFRVLDNGCWEWTDAPSADGYGYLGVGGRRGKKLPAHRLMYEFLVGPIPQRLDIDHTCRYRRCVNAGHLEPVTRRVNLLRGATITARNATATACVHGHPFDAANTAVYRRGERTVRQCRTCRQARGKARQRKAA